MTATAPQRVRGFRRAHGRRAIILWVIAAVMLVLIAAAAWIGVRGARARDELLAAMPLARSAASAALSGDSVRMSADVDELTEHASSAAVLTSDPVWRAAEMVPWLGENMTAFREAASTVHEVAEDALPPLTELAETFTIDSFAPQEGGFDLTAIAAAAPLISEVQRSIAQANDSARDIDTSSTVAPLTDAIDQLKGLVSEADDVLSSADTATALLPAMLGAEGPRTYLLMSLTNAELRASGGIPGAVAGITAENGVLTLGSVSSGPELGRFDDPVLPLTVAESTLFHAILGRYPQDVTLTPDFARSGELLQEMWRLKTGVTADGVIALDPVTLGYILGATGPIGADSIALTGENTADVLLSEVYSRYETPPEQGVFFAEVTARVFEAVTAGDASGTGLLDALSRGADENRIHAWSAHPEEQELLGATPLGGALPPASADSTPIGVYFNDATAAKMDYYVSSDIQVESRVCRRDERPDFTVGVTMTSSAPSDAATTLPAYVLGDARSGTLGNVSTIVYLYAPGGSDIYSVTLAGQEHSFTAAEHDGRSVAAIELELAPGQTVPVLFSFVAASGSPVEATLQHTPMVRPVTTSLGHDVDCGSVAPSPTDEGTIGALASRQGSSGMKRIG